MDKNSTKTKISTEHFIIEVKTTFKNYLNTGPQKLKVNFFISCLEFANDGQIKKVIFSNLKKEAKIYHDEEIFKNFKAQIILPETKHKFIDSIFDLTKNLSDELNIDDILKNFPNKRKLTKVKTLETQLKIFTKKVEDEKSKLSDKKVKFYEHRKDLELEFKILLETLEIIVKEIKLKIIEIQEILNSLDPGTTKYKKFVDLFDKFMEIQNSVVNLIEESKKLK